MIPAQYLLYKGRTLPVVAQCISNGVPCVAVMEAPGKPALIPVAKAVQAPVRSAPRLVVDNA